MNQPGVMHWDGHNPVPPEMWLLPDWLPFHPGRLWCHCRMVYLPMCYLYGTKFTYAHADSDPTTVTKQHEAAPSKTRLEKPLLGRMPASNTPTRRTCAHRARYNMLHHVLPLARSHRVALPYVFWGITRTNYKQPHCSAFSSFTTSSPLSSQAEPAPRALPRRRRSVRSPALGREPPLGRHHRQLLPRAPRHGRSPNVAAAHLGNGRRVVPAHRPRRRLAVRPSPPPPYKTWACCRRCMPCMQNAVAFEACVLMVHRGFRLCLLLLLVAFEPGSRWLTCTPKTCKRTT
jgi:hypothetical protein